MAQFYTHNPVMPCPHCEERGGARYLEIPPSRRIYFVAHEEFMEEYGVTHEYKCDNCEVEWIITNPEELT